MKTGIELIAEERNEQVFKHNCSVKYDAENNKDMQLSKAAQRLIMPYTHWKTTICPNKWPKLIWRKMVQKEYKDRLIIAGALIAAEIDRLQYLEDHDV
jgi:prophage tail gpP-like protein